MQTRHTAGFPGHRLRVLSGAGDEEAFETEASPPAVAGPLLLDFIPAEGPAASFLRLAAAAATVMASRVRIPVDCALAVLQPARPAQVSGTSPVAARLLEWEIAANQGPASAVLAGGHPVGALQGSGDLRWPQYAEQVYDAGLAGSLAVRLRLDCWREGQGTRAALTFHCRSAGVVSLEAIAAARLLAVPAARCLQGVLEGAATAAGQVASNYVRDSPSMATTVS